MTLREGGLVGNSATIESHSKRWLMLLVLFLARMSLAYQFQTIGAIGPILVDEFRIDFTWLGTLIGLYMLPGMVFAIPSGLIGQKFGAKRIVLLGLTLMAIGGLMTGSHVFEITFAGRLISGIGGVMMNVIMTKMVADWFAQREIVVAMSILVSSWPLGLALGLITFPVIAGMGAWPPVMYTAVAVILVSLVLVALLYRNPPDVPALLDGRFQIALSGREWLLVLITGFVWGTYNVAFIVFISFLPELLTARGYSLTEAGRIVSLLGWGLIIVVPIAGLVAQRLGRLDLLMASSLIITGLAGAVLPFTFGGPFVAAFIVVSVVAGVPAGPILSLPAEALSAENRAVGMGVFFTCFYVSMAVMPAMAGWMRDLFASTAAPVLFAAAMLGLSAIGLAAFRLAQRRTMQLKPA
jgi:MFS family permease